MYTTLLVILILDALVLSTAILLQSGKGGGLAASFGGSAPGNDALLGSRQAGNILTLTSWWGGGIFIFLAFVLQIMSSRAAAPTSVLDKTFSNKPAPTAPATGAKGAPAPSAVPLTPAAPASSPAAPKK